VQRHAPTETIDTLDDLHAALGGNRRALARRSDAPLRAGLLSSSAGQLVEVDDVEHFTTDRLRSLSLYPMSTTFGFDLDVYRALIETWRARAAAVFTRRWSPDFDFAGGRRAERAYQDALRDLLTPIFTGLPLLRIASPDHDVRSAADRLVPALI
jgi:hypothetical protein